jgi:hypothetical protein
MGSQRRAATNRTKQLLRFSSSDQLDSNRLQIPSKKIDEGYRLIQSLKSPDQNSTRISASLT